MIKQGHLAILTASFLVVGGYAFPASITLLGAHMGRHVTNHSSTVFWKADIKGTGVGNRKHPTKHLYDFTLTELSILYYYRFKCVLFGVDFPHNPGT